MKKLELLAPARNYESGKIAVDYGADALYIGGPSFGARAAAGNSIEDIARLVDYARLFGVRVYAALNTLVFEDELAQAEAVARELIAAGVDALIIQDTAFLRMGLQGVEFHASTQMCNTTPEGVRFLQAAGFMRAILERGLTLDEIRAIRAATGIELECFVHGAICVGFSGQCYLSRSMGPRSGNRGDCMQACRLSYDLMDADGRAILKNKHLLSVPDLDLSARIGDLIDAGITSFKIEGRLKDESYVKNIVAHYSSLLDTEIARRKEFARSSAGCSEPDFTPDPANSFTRGGSEWMLGGNRRGLASFDTPKATGEYVGLVEEVMPDSFRISDGVHFSPGDGICYMAGGELKGTYINKVRGREIWPDKMTGIAAGTKIYRNYFKGFEDMLRRSRTRRQIDVDAELEIGTDGLVLRLTDEDGVSVSVAAEGGGEPAKDPARMLETFLAQLQKSGESVFRVTTLFVRTKEGAAVPFMPVSAINDLRRRGLDELLAARLSRPHEIVRAEEDATYPYPSETLGGDANVTNRLAEAFYRDHGVRHINRAFDLSDALDGECVMTSAYCIRREIGECLREKPAITGDLFLRRGGLTYRLVFDCTQCRMKVVKEK